MAVVRLSKDLENEEKFSLKVEYDHPKAPEEQVLLTASENRKEKKGNWNYYLRYVSLVVLVVQNTGQVLLMRYASRREQVQFLKTVTVFFNEVLKLIASTILFIISTGSIKESLRLFKHHFITDFFDTLKVGVPSIIYTIQNLLLYVAIDHLDAATFMVTYQLKILTTAMFTVLMLRRRLSVVQWISLCVLIGGVVLVQINAERAKGDAPKVNLTAIITTTHDPDTGPSTQYPLIGLGAVLTACFMSGFAGIYLEKILKGSDVSIWLRNIQLAALSLPISLIFVGVKDHEKVLKNGLMQGFDIIVWCVVATQAFGGLIVAVVINAVASIFIFNIIPRIMFIGGAILVIGAVVLYSIFPYRAPPTLPVVSVDEQKIELDRDPSVDDLHLEKGALPEKSKTHSETENK